MNKTERFEIFQKLDSLFTYSQLLPDEFRDKYMEDIDLLRKKLLNLSSSENNISEKAYVKPETSKETFIIDRPKPENEKFVNKINDEKEELSSEPLLKPNPANNGIRSFSDESDKVREIKKPTIGMKPVGKPSAPPPPPIHNINSFTDFKKNITSLNQPPKSPEVNRTQENVAEKNNEPIIKRSSFELVTGLLIPKLTDKGKTMRSDLSLPIDDYLVLKLIDDKSTLYKLFENYHNRHNSSFIDFANTLYSLEMDKCVSFIKTETTVKDMGIIKLEDLIADGKVVSENNINKAIEYQKAHGGSFLGKTLTELKYLTDNNLGFCMKIQKWVSRMFEKAEYVNLRAANDNIAEHPTQTITKANDKPVITTLPGLGQQPGKPLMNLPHLIKPEIVEEKPVLPVLEFVVPVFNQKGKDIIASPEHQELAKRLKIIDETSSLLDLYWIHRDSFKKNKLAFLKFILKLASQEILEYKANSENDEKIVWVRFGELLITLGIINQTQVEEALEYAENSEKEIFIGEAMLALNYIDQQTLDDCLKVQNWYNSVLASISYERTFVDAIKSVLKDSFKCMVDIGSLRKVSFQNPLKDIVYITYNISGKLKGRVFYISDRAFMQQLANSLMNSVGNNSTMEFDESYVATVCTVIISNSLAKLSQMGMFSSSDIPKIIMEKEVIMDKEIVVADRNMISMIPLINDFGRFAIGLEVQSV